MDFNNGDEDNTRLDRKVYFPEDNIEHRQLERFLIGNENALSSN